MQLLKGKESMVILCSPLWKHCNSSSCPSNSRVSPCVWPGRIKYWGDLTLESGLTSCHCLPNCTWKSEDFCTVSMVFAGSEMMVFCRLAIYTMNDIIKFYLAKTAANILKYLPNPLPIKTVLLKLSAPKRKRFYCSWLCGFPPRISVKACVS